MIFKMALSNIKKAYKDYAIYFLTLTIAIIMFFLVNSLSSEIAEKLFKQQYQIDSFKTIIRNVIIAVTFGLLFLVVYANQFIMKRRYKELALYTLFGLSKTKVILVITLETLVIGILSLLVGIGLAEILSQIVNHFAVQFFLSNTTFELSFNPHTSLITTMVFSVIFFITIIFNAIYIAKSKLIHLLQYSKKGEKFYKLNPVISILLLCFSISIYLYLYSILLNHNDFVEVFNNMGYYILIGIFNTFVFFYAISGIIVFIIKSNKNSYYKSLNILTYNLLSQKMRTHFISLSIISLLLFFGVAATTLTLSLNHSVNDSINNQITADVGVYVVKKDSNFNLQDVESKYGLTLKESFNYKTATNNQGIPANFVSVEEFNYIRKTTLQLKKDEFIALPSKAEIVNESILNYVQSFSSELKNGKPIDISLDMGNTFIVVNKEVYDNLDNAYEIIAYKFNDNTKKFQDKSIEDMLNNEIIKQYTGIERMYFKSALAQTLFITQFVLVVVGVYMSSVLILSGITMIAIQQLSSAKDNVDNYRIMNFLGAEKKSVKKSVAIQVGIYFVLPLIFSIVNSNVALSFISKEFKEFSGINLMNYVLPIYIVIIALYFMYGYVTYRAYYKYMKR